MHTSISVRRVKVVVVVVVVFVVVLAKKKRKNVRRIYFPTHSLIKVNVSSETWLRLKWGVAELIIRSREPPIVCPVWHVGFDDILPNRRPYFPRSREGWVGLVGWRWRDVLGRGSEVGGVQWMPLWDG